MTGVRTDAGDIEAEVVVNCAGQWAKALGDQVGVTVPLHSAEHFYVVTDQLEGVHADLPILRDPDGYIYVKEEVGGLVVGGFEPVAKPWVAPSEIPYPFEFQLLDEDWEHFSILMESALKRIPALEHDRDPQVLQRARELHAGQPVPARRGTRARRLLRRRGLQLGRHRVGRRRGARAGRVGGPGRAVHGPHVGRRTPLLAVRRRRDLAAQPGRRDPRPALRRAVAQPRAGDRARRPALAPARARGRRRGDVRHPQRLGAAAVLRAAARLRLGQAGLARAQRRRAGRLPDGGGGLRPDVVQQVRRPRARRARHAAVGVRRRRGRRGRAGGLHAVAQRPRCLRVGRHGHPGRRRRVPRRVERRDDRARPGLARRARRPRAPRSRSSTGPATSPCSA